MRIFQFKLPRKDGFQHYILAIPEDKIQTIETQWGSHNVYCKVNGIEVDCSYEALINTLGNVIKVT